MPSRVPGTLVALAASALAALVVAPARAQENFEIQVYGSETVSPGTTMVQIATRDRPGSTGGGARPLHAC
jgi:hypothetical protein